MASFALLCFGILTLVLSATTLASAYQCTENQFRTCDTSIALELSRNEESLSQPDLVDHCRTLREGLNCITWYSTTCFSFAQRVSAGELVKKTREYLRRTCEYIERVDENWQYAPCFRNERMETCEDEFQKNMKNEQNTASEMTCNKFTTFRHCIKDAMDHSGCSVHDNIFLYTYLIDRTGELTWLCSDDSRDLYRPINDQSVPHSSAFGALKGAMCLPKVKSVYDKCMETFEQKQTSIRKIYSGESGKERGCCAFGDLTHCVREEVKQKCSTDGQNFIDTLLKNVESTIGKGCQEFYKGSPRCSACGLKGIASTLLMVLLAKSIINWLM